MITALGAWVVAKLMGPPAGLEHERSIASDVVGVFCVAVCAFVFGGLIGVIAAAVFGG